jgi:hypothetical protein
MRVGRTFVLQPNLSAVYVDNFILAAVEDVSGKLLQKMARATLHAIHCVFPLPRTVGMLDAKDPVSEKKLAKGMHVGTQRRRSLGIGWTA